MAVCLLVKAKNTVCDLNRRRCMGLMSHEIHDTAALYQLPQVRQYINIVGGR